MELARYVVDAVVLEGRSYRDVARTHGVSKSWVGKILRRYRDGGYKAIVPRSRAPIRIPHRTPGRLEDEIVALRKDLADQGLDAGAETIHHHLSLRHERAPSVSTIWRVLRRRGFVVPQPHKRPRSSWVRFEARLPNECWQSDVTHWRLADGTEVMQTELLALGIDYRHSRPYHPQTCGKVERFHQTLKAFLAKQPRARTIAELQAQVDRFTSYYNEVRPHRARGRSTPRAAFDARDKARASGPKIRIGAGVRVRRDRIDNNVKVTLRHRTRLHHIGVGHAHKNKRVILLVHDLDVRVVSTDGELLRRLTLDPSRDYQPQG